MLELVLCGVKHKAIVKTSWKLSVSQTSGLVGSLLCSYSITKSEKGLSAITMSLLPFFILYIYFKMVHLKYNILIHEIRE